MSNIRKQLKVALGIAKKAEIEALIATKKAQKAVDKIAKLKKELSEQHKKLVKKVKEKIKKNNKDNDEMIECFSKKRIKKARKKKALK